jgi:hypothetical protein
MFVGMNIIDFGSHVQQFPKEMEMFAHYSLCGWKILGFYVLKSKMSNDKMSKKFGKCRIHLTALESPSQGLPRCSPQVLGDIQVG